jgi:hypothetical protein
MAVKIEVGKKYELNNGDVHECVRMSGGDPTAVDKYGFGPFVINGVLYHQDGRVADCGLNHDLSVKREVITIEHGKYYRTRDGRKVGPMEEEQDGDFMAEHPDKGGYFTASWNPNGKRWMKEPNLDLIAEWGDETRDPELTSPYGDGNHPLPDVTSASESPKTWGEMSDDEKGASATMEAIEYIDEVFDSNLAQRVRDELGIKPEPKRETVVMYGGTENNGKSWGFYTTGANDQRWDITFDTIDGEPDISSIKMERV